MQKEKNSLRMKPAYFRGYAPTIATQMLHYPKSTCNNWAAVANLIRQANWLALLSVQNNGA